MSQIILNDQLKARLEDGIVCAKFIDKNGETNHRFLTTNEEFISAISDNKEEWLMEQGDHSFQNGQGVFAYDVLKGKATTFYISAFEGDIIQIAKLTEPDKLSITKDAYLYLGDKTGPVSITNEMLSKMNDVSLEELQFKDDSACLKMKTQLSYIKSIDSATTILKGIHILKDDGLNEKEDD